MSKKTKKRTFKRPVLGDIVEIPLSKGFAYAQYVNRHTVPPFVYGDLIRILPGVFEKRPKEFAELSRLKELYYVFCPLGSAVRRKTLTLVAAEDVPEECREFPLFKTSNTKYYEETKTWGEQTWFLSSFLCDGKRKYEKLKKLPKKYYNLSMLQVVNEAMLIERIEKGWQPKDEVKNP